MKKKYVKPMFMAQPYEMTEYSAACNFDVKPNTELELKMGVCLCSNEDGHIIGKGDMTGEQLSAAKDDGTAAYLFTNGQASCDFLWHGGSTPVQGWQDGNGDWVWAESEREAFYSADPEANGYQTTYGGWHLGTFAQSFMKFFTGCEANEQNHRPAYNGMEMFS